MSNEQVTEQVMHALLAGTAWLEGRLLLLIIIVLDCLKQVLIYVSCLVVGLTTLHFVYSNDFLTISCMECPRNHFAVRIVLLEFLDILLMQR